jgi:hypothetical protein
VRFSAEDNEYAPILRESCEPAVDGPEEVVEVLVAFGQCRICKEIICIHHTLTSKYILIHSMKYIL